MRILLTGSTGWLGRYLAPRLRAGGHEVIGLDVAPGPDTQIVGTIADRAVVDRAIAGCDAVVHSAALHKPDIVRYPTQAFIDVNVTGTLNLLEAAVAAGCTRFVFTSTTSLMITRDIRDEAGDAAVWLDEDSGPLAPRNIYGVTKRAAEELCRLVQAERGLPVVVLRTARFFPEEDDTHRSLSGENMKANELLNRRLTVQDCAEAHVAALERAPGSVSACMSCRHRRHSRVRTALGFTTTRRASSRHTFRMRRHSMRSAAGRCRRGSGGCTTPAG